MKETAGTGALTTTTEGWDETGDTAPIPAPIPAPTPLPSRPGFKVAFAPTFWWLWSWSWPPLLLAVPPLFKAGALFEIVRVLPLITCSGLLAAAIMVNCFPLQVTPQGIRGYDCWGRERSVAWSAVDSVRSANCCGLRFLRLAARDGRAVLWLPEFVTDAAAWRREVLRVGESGTAVWNYYMRSQPAAKSRPRTVAGRTPLVSG